MQNIPDKNESMSTLRFTLGVLTNKLKRLPLGTAEWRQCADELLDINDKINSLQAAMADYGR
ncbi:hypothetical protein [Hymenobacter psychrotolerans]|uniref:Uncharacterized protein n=1 Tax=Hymenobacter psychrotolerans DSM 18569 TaxID=1121959 RepID=A0A1M7E8Y8_9BACT|nr:hypothetical protein [Hymenobacter psychrotolerans]SHL88116.1 hypothetical protein SAMN02746009_03554 [Hymenobacter psychrotolerans DSM 18569]